MPSARRFSDASGGERISLVFPTDVARVGEAVEVIAAYCFGRTEPSPRTRFRLCTVVAEALANAMVYGNRNDTTRQVTVELKVFAEYAVITVTDEGEGFDPVSVPHPQQALLESTTGRGLFLIRQLADQVEFNAQGSTISMTLPRT